MNRLFIVRHGKTDWNNEGRLQGTMDIDLNDEGIKDAKDLSKKIDLSLIDICICSPLIRTKHTADILVNNKIKIIYDDLLKERCLGNYEGQKVRDDSLISKLWDYNLNYSLDNVESIKDCLSRAKSFLNKINKEYNNKNILIVTHGAFLKALHFNLIGYSKSTDFMSFNPQNTTLYKYYLEGDKKMKKLIVYYSLTGNCDYVAEKISKNIDADVVKLIPKKLYPDKGFKKYFWCGKSAVMNEEVELEKYNIDFDKYNQIIFGTPVWAGTFAPPLRTFINDNKKQIINKKISLFVCCGGGNTDKTINRLKELLELDEFDETLILVDPKDKPNIDNDKKIDNFCKKG